MIPVKIRRKINEKGTDSFMVKKNTCKSSVGKFWAIQESVTGIDLRIDPLTAWESNEIKINSIHK